ncbi:hypothetical protein BC938DRAFT_474069 [Jimgerdemannia flammicorona]|uniref:Uncharacterized protein n=1 Tax=Jimgerdemannia flammicorona TaxID=994334 RepID=A0A433QZL0_9FUNG|nr:hypothetical protein BC938DRAFT_474069 [Jimgerdemannia flammicorona]
MTNTAASRPTLFFFFFLQSQNSLTKSPALLFLFYNLLFHSRDNSDHHLILLIIQALHVDKFLLTLAGFALKRWQSIPLALGPLLLAAARDEILEPAREGVVRGSLNLARLHVAPVGAQCLNPHHGQT